MGHPGALGSNLKPIRLLGEHLGRSWEVVEGSEMLWERISEAPDGAPGDPKGATEDSEPDRVRCDGWSLPAGRPFVSIEAKA